VRRALTTLVLAVMAGLALAPAASGENNASPGLASSAAESGARASLADIEDEVMCPICGTTLQLSQSPHADRERAFIQRLVAQGRTKDEIKDALVAEYGSEVLALPDTEGFDLAAWVVPAAALVIAGTAIAVGLRRWRRRDGWVDEGDPAGLDPADAERLDTDLARYDL
jgi:cytochrome c-type biogenesis protein CcmH